MEWEAWQWHELIETQSRKIESLIAERDEARGAAIEMLDNYSRYDEGCGWKLYTKRWPWLVTEAGGLEK